MINQKVTDMLLWVYAIFDVKILTLIAAGFAIYFGYQKITRKICVSYRVSGNQLYVMHIENLVFSNKRDNSIVISSIRLRIGEKGNFTLVEFDKPAVLKAYDVLSVDVPKYSGIYDGGGNVFIEPYDNLVFYIITTAGKVIECTLESHGTLYGSEERLYKKTSKFRDIVLTDRMAYIFTYYLDGKLGNTIIDNHGRVFGDRPFSHNSFPLLSVESFRDFLIASGVHDILTNYELYKVNASLITDKILNKRMVSEYMKNKG